MQMPQSSKYASTRQSRGHSKPLCVCGKPIVTNINIAHCMSCKDNNLTCSKLMAIFAVKCGAQEVGQAAYSLHVCQLTQ